MSRGKGRPWTKQETDTLIRLKKERTPIYVIAARLNRTIGTVETHLYNYSSLFAGRCGPVQPAPSVDPAALAELERARSAPQSLTAMFFGDPLPGRSALDNRLAGNRIEKSKTVAVSFDAR